MIRPRAVNIAVGRWTPKPWCSNECGAMAVVKAVAHTGITVRDLDASISFWRDVFGFEVQHRLELSGEFAEQITGVADAHFVLAVLAGGGHHIELLQYLRPTERAHVCPRPCDVGSFHVAVNVDDLDSAAEACAQRGWTARRQAADGRRRAARRLSLRVPARPRRVDRRTHSKPIATVTAIDVGSEIVASTTTVGRISENDVRNFTASHS